MNRADLVELIAGCIRDSMPPSATIPTLDENTRIFGKDGFLDSMQLVNVLMEIEQRVSERHGVNISVADDRAMSQERSPFRRIGTLADYIIMLVSEPRTSA